MEPYRSPIQNEVVPSKNPLPPYNGFLYQLNKSRAEIEQKACQDIRFSKPLVSLGETGIIYPNSITTLQGQKGSHKSRLIEIICAVILSKLVQENPIGVIVDKSVLYHIVYVDTERNKNDQFPYAIQRIKEKAGYEKTGHPSNLEAVTLIDINREDRFEALTQYLEQVRNQNPNKFIIVILDVITDCIGSFNDPKESLKLIDHLNQVINQYDVSFICVIHENPNSVGDSKARGHLGTELINKATTALNIGFEKSSRELINIKFLHTRSSRKPEPILVRYCDQEKGLVLADESFVSAQKSLRATKAGPEELKGWFTENLFGDLPKSELLTRLTNYFNCTDKTIETRLKELTEGADPFLMKSKKGKEVYFSRNSPF